MALMEPMVHMVDMEIMGRNEMDNQIKNQKDFYVRHLKPFFDKIASFIGIIFFLLPLTIIIFVIYQFGKDKGPIFFTQHRLGKNGKIFKIIKFRSMVLDAEDRLRKNPELYQKYIENSYKLPPKEDPRLTRIGHFIRSTSIDEFPQFINVLRGEMSLIGPRPILEKELLEYDENDRKLLLSVYPGATGWWQVSGRSEIYYPERCELELYYPRNASLKLDIKILYLTIKKVISKAGAH